MANSTRRPAVTLRDVAALAGVSISIASQALRGTGRMRPETRQRVRDAAARLDFRPNAIAQSFTSGRSLAIGIIVEKPSDIFTMPVVMGATSELGDRDMSIIVYDTHENPERRAEIVRKLRSRLVDGVIVVGNGTKHSLASVTDRFDVPVVYAFGQSDGTGDLSFLPDGVEAGRLAGQHLIEIGRRRIAHITAAGDQAAVARASGLEQTLTGAGLTLALGSPLVGDWTQAWGARAGAEILRRRDEVDAVFCGNDQIAFGLFRTLQLAGVRIPDDVAIVGYDHMGKFIDSAPVVTTIDPHLSELGAAAAKAVVAERAGRTTTETRYVAPQLIPGLSTRGTADDERILPIF